MPDEWTWHMFGGLVVKILRSIGLAALAAMATGMGAMLAQQPAPMPPGQAGVSTPTTYCNPLPLPNYPLGKRARDVFMGAPPPKDDWLWLVGAQQQGQEEVEDRSGRPREVAAWPGEADREISGEQQEGRD